MPPKNSQNLSDIRWNVEPYRWIEDLADAYTVALISAVDNEAETLAADIQEWMYKNAPWKDRPVEKRLRYRKDNGEAYEVHEAHARKQLTADVIRSYGSRASTLGGGQIPISQEEYEASTVYRRQQATKIDIQRLAEVNKVRQVAGRIPLTSLPKSRSESVAINKQIKRELPRVFKIRMYYKNAVPYALWLEIANGGKYNILARTVAYWGSKMEAKIRSLANLKNLGITPVSNQQVRQSAEQVNETYHEALPAKLTLKRYRKEKKVEAKTGVGRKRKPRSDKGVRRN